MTLPNWKKSRLARVSRLVVDLHRHPPKHGSSLLLHTGFPTSLLDLFLKNRDRFNKGLPTRSNQPPPPLITDQLIAVLPLQEASSSSSSPMTDDHRLFLGLFKVFVILGLALGAAQFAWAMAAAAFSLLSLELLAKSRGPSEGRPNEQVYNYKVVGSDNPLPDHMKRNQQLREPTIKSHKSRANLIKKLMKRKKKREQIINSPMPETAALLDEESSAEATGKPNHKEKETERRILLVLDGAEAAGHKDYITRNRNQKTGKSGYANHPNILMVIVLCGLMAGRIPALLVTVSWCLILRYVEKDATTC